MTDLIVMTGSVITACILIWRAIVFFVHLSDMIKDMHRHTFENYMSCLRLTIMCADMPHGERVVAANKYMAAGGNGEVKKFAITHLHVNDIEEN